MDLYKEFLFDRLNRFRQNGRAGAFDYALLLKEALKYEPGDRFLLAELGSVLHQAGLTWESYVVLQKAHEVHGLPSLRRIIERIENPPLPVTASIEVSTVCHLACPMCRFGSGRLDRAGRIMSFEDFRTVWDKIKDHTQRLFLTGQGEFFIHENAYDILSYINGQSEVRVDTSGDVDLDIDRLLACPPDEIVFSIDGIDPGMYGRYRRGGDFGRVTGNLKKLVAARNQRGLEKPRVGFQFILFRHTEMFEAEAEELARSLGADEFVTEPARFEPDFGKARFMEFMPLAPKNQSLEWADFERGEVGRSLARDSRHCRLAADHLVVDVNGDVAACPGADRSVRPPMCNLIDESLGDVWQSPEARDFRLRVFRDRSSEPACRCCSLPLASHARLLDGTEFAEPPPDEAVSPSRFYTRDYRVNAEEIQTLRAIGRRAEADYFIAIGRADDPGESGGDEVLDVLTRIHADQAPPADPEKQNRTVVGSPDRPGQVDRRQTDPEVEPNRGPGPSHLKPGELSDRDIRRLSLEGDELATQNRLEEAKERYVRVLAARPDHPDVSRKLLQTLWAMLQANAERMRENRGVRAVYFDRQTERNPNRGYFMKYVPEELAGDKTGLNVLFVSDMEIAGNQIRFMNMLNRHTTHKARNIILKRDYLNYGEDLVLDRPETIREARELVTRADFFHFTRCIPTIPGVDWQQHLRVDNCLVDYFGGDIKFNKQNVTEFHRRTGVMGVNKYDFGQYVGAEFLIYHFPTMFDSSAFTGHPVDLGFYDKARVVIGHAPTNPERKHTHRLLPIVERVNQQVPQEVTVDLIMGVSNEEAMRRKAGCDIVIDLVRPENDHLSGCPGQNSHESLALGKVTICSMDNFFMSFYPDTPIFSCSLENLESLILKILSDRRMVEWKMRNAREWLQQFMPMEVMRKYLHIYQYVTTRNRFVTTGDSFFQELDPRADSNNSRTDLLRTAV